ncbi:MAG: hypothetical protein Q7U82_00835 [Gammaproteobacteria bacterium]|nr:hypothetical protein [Gammaproteobacteria bacterium]
MGQEVKTGVSKFMGIKDDLERLEKLHDFPTKGATVLGYFVDMGEVSGAFYVAVVEQSGKKQFCLRWGDLSTEKFTSIRGKNSVYQYFNILGYINFSFYQDNFDKSFREIKQWPSISDEPCAISINAFRDQHRKVALEKKKHKDTLSKIPMKIEDGTRFDFIYYRGLGEPVMVREASAMVDGCDIFANVDKKYRFTKKEARYLYVPRKLIVRA